MEHDVITVGGGMVGSALAKALAEAGLRVLVLERETAFRDRVRGEQMLCWGVAEAQALGVHDLLRQTCGHEVRHWSTRIAGAPEAPPRDLVETTPQRTAALDFYHPAMQEALLGAAEAAGAEVRRGVAVLGVAPGERPAVRIRLPDGAERTLTARLVVGADRRNSACRGWAGFAVERDPERLVVAGVLLDGLGAPEDRVSLFLNPGQGLEALTVPLGGGRFRSYAAWFAPPGEDRRHLSGRRALGELVARSVAAGAPAAWFARAEAAGPLASFEGADHWVPHPYRDGVALVGDAAAVSDPSFGSGLSLALRDARVLRDRLLAPGAGDRDTAGHAYANEHDRHYGAIHRIIGWLTTLFCDPRPEAAAVRAGAAALGRRPQAGRRSDRARAGRAERRGGAPAPFRRRLAARGVVAQRWRGRR